MGSTSDKIKGTANEAIGKAKQGIGEATGSDRLQGEGVVQEVKGKGQKAMGDAKDCREGSDRSRRGGGEARGRVTSARLKMKRPASRPVFLFAR